MNDHVQLAVILTAALMLLLQELGTRWRRRLERAHQQRVEMLKVRIALFQAAEAQRPRSPRGFDMPADDAVKRAMVESVILGRGLLIRCELRA